MKTKHYLSWSKLALIVGSLALPFLMQAGSHPRYKLVDLGTLGGPQYYDGFSGIPPLLLNEQGTVIGGMDTAIPDPFCFNSDCLVSHAFQWQRGILSDLGLSIPTDFSQAFWINNRGDSVGVSLGVGQNPSGPIILTALLWKNGQVSQLGTLGGDQSVAQAINNRGQAVGWALNTVPDAVGIWFDYPFPLGTQQRAVIWQNGHIEDLGTLGGPDAWASGINDAGQVTGQSYTSDSTVSPITGARPIEVFLWHNGKIISLGNLGGTMGVPNKINNQGQVVGWMTLEGDEVFHPFVSENGTLDAYSFEVNPAGATVYEAHQNVSLYRTFRMTDMYTPN
jgi:probable HAF family extracellular repeat protein